MLHLQLNTQSLYEKLNTVTQLFENFSGAAQPTLYYNPTGQAKRWAEQIALLNQPYIPTPWLFNTHLQLFYFDMIRKKTTQLEYDHEELLTMQDGGTTALYWSGYNLPDDVPTVFVLHTIMGTPQSMRELVRDLRLMTGWRVVLCLRRGHADLKLTTPRLSIVGSTDDLREQISVVRERFKKSSLYCVGVSAGTGLLVRYLGEMSKKSAFKAAFAYCPGYNLNEVFKVAHKAYSQYMTHQLIKTFVLAHQNQISQLSTYQALISARDLHEFQLAVYELAGFESYEVYEKAANPIYVFDQVTSPLMMLNSGDDPVCRLENAQAYLDKICEKDNIMLVTTPKGSHCAYYEGWKASSWAHRLIADFFTQFGDTQDRLSGQQTVQAA